MDPRTLNLAFQILKLYTLCSQLLIITVTNLIGVSQVVRTSQVPLNIRAVILELTLEKPFAVLKNLMSSGPLVLTPGVFNKTLNNL